MKYVEWPADSSLPGILIQLNAAETRLQGHGDVEMMPSRDDQLTAPICLLVASGPLPSRVSDGACSERGPVDRGVPPRVETIPAAVISGQTHHGRGPRGQAFGSLVQPGP